MEELSKDELWAIYKTLPDTLKEAIFSEDTADAIWNVCQLHNIEKTSEVAKLVGQVLMGLLPLEYFKDTLKDELSLSEDIAKKASLELEHYVFNQVKEELDKLYEDIAGKKAKAKKEPEAEKRRKADKYREAIE